MPKCGKPFRYSSNGINQHDYQVGEEITYEPAIDHARKHGFLERSKAAPSSKVMKPSRNKSKKKSLSA